jgi:hypothetical protein
MKPTVYIETTIPSLLTSWPSGDLQIAAQQVATRDRWERLRCAGFHPAGAMHAPRIDDKIDP